MTCSVLAQSNTYSTEESIHVFDMHCSVEYMKDTDRCYQQTINSYPPSLYVGLVIYALENKNSSCEHQGDQNKKGVWEVILQ